MMRNIILLSLLMITVISSCNSGARQEEEVTVEESFIQKISAYCGQELTGEIVAEEQQPEFIGPIRFRFLNCTDKEIRILAVLPDDRQKTIILTLMEGEILLKHDVRNPDLSPANYTMYGGFSNEAGDENRQFFPIHNFGQSMWPGFENFSWEISIKQGGNLEYTERTGNVVMKHYVLPLTPVN